MKLLHLLLGVGLVLLLGIAPNAQAIPITMNFTVEGFGILNGTDAVPTDPVSGTIVWDGVSVNAPINYLTSIRLTLNSYSYSLTEIMYISPWNGSIDIIGGSLSAVGVKYNTNDFWMRWNRDLTAGIDFVYASSGLDAVWQSTNFTSFDISAAPVPEPATMLLFGTGLAGVVGLRLRKKKK